MNKNIILGGILVLIVVLGLVYRSPKNEVNNNTTSEKNNEISLAENERSLNLVSGSSNARYEIDEVLNGKPVRVLGNNEKITGSVILDTATNKIIRAEINLDANSFVTDIAKRDENVKALVLKTNEENNKNISFKSTNIEGLPESIVFNQAFPVKITGDLTIAGTTKQVPFDGNITYNEDGSMKVEANTKLAYEEFGIKVPDFPFLSDVSKNTDLFVSFVAK